MLLKKLGNCWANALRVILPFKPDFNQNNKMIGLDVMHTVPWSN